MDQLGRQRVIYQTYAGNRKLLIINDLFTSNKEISDLIRTRIWQEIHPEWSEKQFQQWSSYENKPDPQSPDYDEWEKVYRCIYSFDFLK